ncbi:TIGR03084 family protein [Actinomadura rubrobrunea]|uniref:TIGR03084 family protein n=1 Tax=Actinomadura rubrobrunea TaxID=115335 RepID=A0A9W6UWJ1_9ACTN|nr:TIGR03084 family metal-binding protein [Actinomadura rubrobrunea]GLW65088.1 TIGR03084 family protein [Actinomadura rubrobrunea]
MADPGPILADLAAESRELDDLVAREDVDWSTPTPAPGWTIAHQIAHLAWTDAKALIAARTPDDFPAERERAIGAGDDYVDRGAREGARRPRGELLAAWRRGREELAAALAAVPEGRRLPWYGPPMSAASMATARLMETWAHAQDVFDALGVEHAPTARLRHVAHIGVRTRDFSFQVRGLRPPGEEFRIELTGPDGDVWTWGPPDARQSVAGDALDFCLVVTQRRHPADTGLTAVGADAARWLEIAQAFAGPPGRGRRPGEGA